MSEAPGERPMVKVREGAVVWREVESEVVLLHLESSDYMAMNPTAAVLWPPMVEGTTRAALIERLSREFALGTAKASADVDAFLAQCRAGGLLEP